MAIGDQVVMHLEEVTFSFDNSNRRLLPRSLRRGHRKEQAQHPAARPALRNISLEIRDGDRIGLVGSNGSGKSTLLRLLAGIYEPDAGSITRNGRIAAVLDVGYSMNSEATGEDSAFTRCLYEGLTWAEAKPVVEEIHEFTGLGEKFYAPVRTYSSGMQSRLSIGLSTQFTGDVLLLDEGIGAADLAFLRKAQSRIESFLAASGTLVLASHDENLLRGECTDALWLRDGDVAGFGPIDEILEAYHQAYGQ